jgi:hypothetical protein
MSKNMKVLILPEDSYNYLKYVYASHTKAGFAPDEVLAAADLFARIERAQTVDFSKLGKVGLEGLTPGADGKVSVNLTPEANLDPPGDHNGAIAND